MRWVRYLALILVVCVAAAAGLGVYVWRRALPQISGEASLPALSAPAEVIRDRWGVPHIFARSDADAYRALGWVMAQDRLFQMDVIRHVSQGRLAELLGAAVVDVDRHFRTLGVPRVGARMFAAARPEVRAALEAFTEGANGYLAHQGGALPPEYAVLRVTPRPFRADDFTGAVGFMAWGLNPSWRMDPLFERIAAKVGAERAAALFTEGRQGPMTFAEPAAGRAAYARPVEPLRPRPLGAAAQAILDRLPTFAASNAFAVAPARSATGGALLANDPHLGHGQPGTWYQAHLSTPEHEVIGVFLPGLPFAVIGHNRSIAWGLVNVNLDGGDFFLEELNPERTQVRYRGEWVSLTEREETLAVKGGDPVTFTVRETPHGPLVDAQVKNGPETAEGHALSYRWVYAVAEDANEADGFYDLNRARNWDGFRAAVGRFGAVAQTALYADREGHIGMQVTGRIPRREGRRDGLGFRDGGSGREEWGGLLPFAANPSVFDPPEGWIAVANAPIGSPTGAYLSGYFEPEDRIARIAELLQARPRHDLHSLAAIQNDARFPSGLALARAVLAAFREQPPNEAHEPAARRALALLEGWDGTMAVDAPAATVIALTYKHLFPSIFGDELGEELLKDLRSKSNESAVMMHAVINGGLGDWIDRQGTPAVEDRAAILRRALRAGVDEGVARLGADPAEWDWGRLHQITFQHPLGRVALLAPLFNLGPHPLPGHAQTVNKAQFHDDDFAVYQGPSMRQLTDLADPARALGIIPTGQSGIPASPHYDDLLPMWLSGAYQPLLMDPADIGREAEGRLLLRPN